MSEYPKMAREILEKFSDGSPVGKVMDVARLRDFFSHMTLPEGVDLIDSISDIRQLYVLIGVGMKGFLYYKTTKRIAELMGV